MKRECGECTLCCKLLPMQRGSRSVDDIAAAAAAMVEHGLATVDEFRGMILDFDKPAGKRCPHQRHAHGCAIYAKRPFGCRMWNCRWLTGDDTADLRRPDRSRYVIDIMPDYITMQDNSGSPPRKVQVVQIWCDPKHRDAWRDPVLLAYLERRGKEGIAALIRWGQGPDAVTVFPPSMSSDHQWHEVTGRCEGDHRGKDLITGLAACAPVHLNVPEDQPAAIK